MDRLINSLRVRLIGVVLVIHAALVPLLYLGVSVIIQEGYAELFVNSVRSFSRLTADELEASGERDVFEVAVPEVGGGSPRRAQIGFLPIIMDVLHRGFVRLALVIRRCDSKQEVARQRSFQFRKSPSLRMPAWAV